MESIQEMHKYTDFELVEYINTRHQSTVDPIEIESEMNNQKALMKRIDESLYEFFVQSGDSLLSLLDAYKQCLDLVKGFKTDIKYKSETFEEGTVSEKLKKCFNRFKDNLSIFLTESRYFVSSCRSSDESVYLILTNDLLFIGERDVDSSGPDSKKYSLLRSIPKKNVKIQFLDQKLIVILEDKQIVIENNLKDLEEFHESFQEVSYEIKGTIKTQTQIDINLFNFYIQTKHYEELENYIEKAKLESSGHGSSCKEQFKKGDTLEELLMHLEITEERMLITLMNISKQPQTICEQYFEKRLKTCLEEINQIQEFDEYNTDVFEKLETFFNKVETFYNEWNKKQSKEFKEADKLNRNSLILFFERCAVTTLKHISERIKVHSNVFGEEETLQTISKKLDHGKFEFGYLLGKKYQKNSGQSDAMILKDKRAIKAELDEYFGKDHLVA